MTGLLYRRQYPVCDGIVFNIHTIGEIMRFGENRYYEAISSFLATPWDYMWILHEQGIDFEEVSDFELFCMLKNGLTRRSTYFLFGDTLPLHRMVPYQNTETGEIVLLDPQNPESQFNARSLLMVATLIRTVHFMKYERRTPGNAEAKTFFLDRARKDYMRSKRQNGRDKPSVLEPLIIALVNAPEFPYDYETCKHITIYQFMSSVQKIPKRLSWNYVMHGVHVGMISAKDVNWNELNWLSP